MRVSEEGRHLKIGHAGSDLIKSYERCRLRAYLPTPDDKLTVGWGHTGSDVTADTVWTQEEADAAFLKDLEWVKECVNKAVTVQLTQHEYDALCSLCFNIGCPNFGKSTLVKLLNEANYEAASHEFRRWDKQKDKRRTKTRKDVNEYMGLCGRLWWLD